MKLPTRTRKRIRTAGGKPVRINWPEDAPECLSGHKYAVYNDAGRYQFRVRVLSSARWDEGSGTKPEVKATVRIDQDSVRRLPGLSGQRNEAGDYEDEPERVPAAYESQLAVEAQWANIGRGEAMRRIDATKTGGKAQDEAMARAKRRLVEAG
jgi:hypothetical protein